MLNKRQASLVGFLLAGILTGCTATQSADRPVVETNYRPGSANWVGMIEGDYYSPQTADTDLSTLPVRPGVRYVKVDAPGYRAVTVEGGADAVRAALARVTEGFVCPVRGRVFVGALIDATGQSHGPRVTGGIHPACDAKALEVFVSLRYVPALVDGQPVAMPLGQPIDF